MRGRQALGAGLAVALTAGAAWFGIGAATAGSEQDARGGSDRLQFRGWQGKAVDSVAQAQRSAKGVRTLTLVADEVRAQDVDLGAQGESAGDFFLFEDTLYNTNGRKVGRDAGRCELGIRTFTCEATIQLDGRGKIRVAGTVFGPPGNVFPVTGGTKDFLGVGGQLQVLQEGSDELLVLELVR